MIRHIVLWRFLELTKEGDKKQNLQTAQQMLNEMATEIEGIIDIKIGINMRKGNDRSDLALSMLFEDQTALDIYQKHPAHQKVKDFLGEVRYERRVIDYEVTD
ncbi:MAG: Dabb family protein [Candidatus Stygibacter frigidus]|nr:Dabb family protein [Candidatus Stygibacter frigidus]